MQCKCLSIEKLGQADKEGTDSIQLCIHLQSKKHGSAELQWIAPPHMSEVDASDFCLQPG